MIIGTGIHILSGQKRNSTFLIEGVAGAVFWFKADDLVLNGSDVERWNDKTGQGNHVSQLTTSAQPLYVSSGGPNNKPYVEFDGVDEFLQGSWTQTQPLHGFMVVLPTVAKAAGPLGIFTGSNHVGPAAGLVEPSDITKMNLFYGTNLQAACDMRSWHLVEYIANGANSSIKIDSGTPSTGPGGAADPNGKTIAKYFGSFLDPRIAEIMEFDSVLSAGDVTAIRSYLTTEYSL